MIPLLVVVAIVTMLAPPLARWVDHDPDARIPGNGYLTADRRAVGRLEGPKILISDVPPALACDTLPRALDPIQLSLRFDDATI